MTMPRKKKAPATVRKPARRPAARRTVARQTARRARAAAPRSRIPYQTVTPYLAVSDAAAAIDWYKRAFGARELSRMPTPDGKVMHAEILIGDSRVMLSDVFPGSDVQHPRAVGTTTINLHVYHRNVDRLWRQAIAAGATVTMPLDDQFWGDRYGKLTDPFGHSWALSFKAKMTKEERERKQREAMAMFGAGARP
jgi:PhnB protein